MCVLSDTVIIGIGNPLCGDDGVGIALLEALEGRVDADLVDAGTSAMQVVHALAGRHRAILLDCARMGLPFGTLRRFTPEEVANGTSLPRLSLHEGDLLAFLALARNLGAAPEEIILFGIEPASLEPAMHLSSILVAQMGDYLTAIIAEAKAPFHSI
ncbi:MAG: Hydrogenase 2 maturation protease [bacterium ADurb.Bin429]|nr:MAG: Hydrogenase 2 maturation protease [bacterium ADurb.Bin429]